MCLTTTSEAQAVYRNTQHNAQVPEIEAISESALNGVIHGYVMPLGIMYERRNPSVLKKCM